MRLCGNLCEGSSIYSTSKGWVGRKGTIAREVECATSESARLFLISKRFSG